MEFLGAERFGTGRIQLAGFAGAANRLPHAFTDEGCLLNTQQERERDGKDGVETEGYALEEERDAICFGGQPGDSCHEYEGLHVAGPGIERQLRRDGRGGRVDNIGQLLMAHPFTIGQGFDGGSNENGAHRSALEEDDAEAPGNQFRGPRTTDELACHEVGKGLGGPGTIPNPEQTAEKPEVEEEHSGGVLRCQIMNQHIVCNIVVAEQKGSHDDAAKQRNERLARDPTEGNRHRGRQQRPPSPMALGQQFEVERDRFPVDFFFGEDELPHCLGGRALRVVLSDHLRTKQGLLIMNDVVEIDR